MLKYPCRFNNPCFDLRISKGFYLQQVLGEGRLEKHRCPYTIYTDKQCEYPHPDAIQHLEVHGEPICTLLPGHCRNEARVHVRIPLLIHSSSCNCDSAEYGYIEETVPVMLCGCSCDLWHCKWEANACVRWNRNNCCCAHNFPFSLDVFIQVYLLCGCIVQAPQACSCPEPKPWYPQPVSYSRR